ncbi:ABC transporter ATP-binding protein [Candidatus Palauibacter sp.]|uniref:ABC transporter ATP-binding protein n=1 Tax=Candidatus Palauibacter sp. TaxID=3101350 RepID=UPI003B5B8D77
MTATVVETQEARPPAVEARGLARTFSSPDGGLIPVLKGIDLDVARGDSVAIVGPSGSGKSTLLHLLGALDKPTRGDVWLGGDRVSELGEGRLAELRNRFVGFVFQFHHLLRDFTALENVMLPQLIAGASPEAAAARASELLAQVGLAERASHRPRRLSGGEQQRVAVARALANAPPLVLADEPSGNLDAEATLRLHDLLFGLIDGHEAALIVVTHSRELAGRAARVLRLEGGELFET